MSNRYSAVRAMTAYESTTAWRAKLKYMRQQFEANQSAASSALSSASIDEASAKGDIIAKIAVARMQAEAKAKAEAEKKRPISDPIDTSKADLKESIFSGDSSAKLDSGTNIDLGKGTITLTNGKTIDIKTGVQVFDFTA